MGTIYEQLLEAEPGKETTAASIKIKEKIYPHLKNQESKLASIPCETYSRVSGYYRPVAQWNKGKQEEFNERQNLSFNYRQNN